MDEMNERNDLERLAAPLVADPPIPRTPVAELRSRAARRTRRRMAAIGLTALVVLACAGTALAVSGRVAPPVQVGTGPGTTVAPGYDLTIYLSVGVTPERSQAVARSLLADPDVTHLLYSSEEATYARFLCLFSYQPQFVESVQPADLPPTYSVGIVGGEAAVVRLYEAVGTAPGVQTFALAPGSGYHIPTTTTTFSIPPGAAGAVGTMQLRRDPNTTVRYCPVTGTTLR